jgi:cysteinyl-tRNA synthetase
MSIRYLGEQIDIHGGGQDVVFPHHENEIAQSESFTGKKPFAKYWIHNGLLSIGGEKGSRSLGNMITIREALQKYSADAIRVFTLGAYYRSPLSFLSDSLEVAERGADRLRLAAAAQGKGDKGSAEIDTDSYRNRFIEVMDDDFGTSQALATLFDMARDINRSSDEGYDVTQVKQVYTELAGVLGLTLDPVKEKLDSESVLSVYAVICSEIGRTPVQDENPEAVLQDLIQARQELRKGKQYDKADLVRNRLDEAGILLEDSAQGTTWKLKR